jgi:hypothetical protein
MEKYPVCLPGVSDLDYFKPQSGGDGLSGLALLAELHFYDEAHVKPLCLVRPVSQFQPRFTVLGNSGPAPRA